MKKWGPSNDLNHTSATARRFLSVLSTLLLFLFTNLLFNSKSLKKPIWVGIQALCLALCIFGALFLVSGSSDERSGSSYILTVYLSPIKTMWHIAEGTHLPIWGFTDVGVCLRRIKEAFSSILEAQKTQWVQSFHRWRILKLTDFLNILTHLTHTLFAALHLFCTYSLSCF